MTHHNDHDTSGKDLLRDHIRAIIDEKMTEYPYSPNDISDDQIDATTDSLIEGLGLHPTYVDAGHVFVAGAYSRR